MIIELLYPLYDRYVLLYINNFKIVLGLIILHSRPIAKHGLNNLNNIIELSFAIFTYCI